MISPEVRDKLKREQRRVLGLLKELRASVDVGDMAGLALRANRLQQSLDAHLALVSYVLESLSDDGTWDDEPPPSAR